MFGNKHHTEINLPVAEDGTLTVDLFINIGLDTHNFGHVECSRYDASQWTHTKNCCLGKVPVSINLAEVDATIDVRGIMIQQIKEDLKKLNADHEVAKSNLQLKLSKLLAIEGKKK